MIDPQNIEIIGKRELNKAIEISNIKGEISEMAEQLENKNQWGDWSIKYVLYDNNTSFSI